jgi:hypothetical protein
VQKFFQFFEVMESNPSATAQAAQLVTKRRNLATSFMGRQATLGPHLEGGPVQHQTETNRGSNRNVIGYVWHRQNQVGEFEAERLDDDAMNKRCVEGVDDSENCCPAQCSRTQQNGARRRNAHDPSAEINGPYARYFEVSNTFQHLGSLMTLLRRPF